MKYLSVFIYHKYVCGYTTCIGIHVDTKYVYMTAFEYALMTAQLQL